MLLTGLCILLVQFVTTVNCRIEEMPLPNDIQACFDKTYQKGNLSVQVGEKVVWHCIHGNLWKRASRNNLEKIPKVAMKWFADLIDKSYREAEARHQRRKRQAFRAGLGGVPNQGGQLRIRREYRMMSDVERNLFHRAFAMLKADTSIPPNRFDALGRVHELLGDRSHDGPNFLGWHRFLLVVAENAMREKVPSVTIPYWDSTLDGGLHDPRSSIMWTENFMGNGNGHIKIGPFSGWATPYGPLNRNYGDGGTMMNWTSIRESFSRRHLAEIMYPHAEPRYNLEDHHGEPHLWIGGYFAPVALAGYDPLFFMHHSFVDLLWELFRRLQRRRGVDPTVDYPANTTEAPGHGFNEPSGFGNLLNRHALSDIFTTEMYTYQLPPTCSHARPTCGSPYIRCDTSGPSAKCVSASIFDVPEGEVFDLDALIANIERMEAAGGRTRRSADRTPKDCPGGCDYPYQRCDTERGVCIAGYLSDIAPDQNIEIDQVIGLTSGHVLTKRSANPNNASLFIHSEQNITAYINNLQTATELQCQPENINEHYVNNYILDGMETRKRWSYIPVNVIVKLDQPNATQSSGQQIATYPKCQYNKNEPYRVFIEAHGVNYKGFYKEIVHVKKDVSVFSSMAFVGIKTPLYNASQSIIAAYDSCGRVCQPYCRNQDNIFSACAGSIRITSDLPFQYEDTIAKTSEMVWREESNGLPELDTNQLFFKVVCNPNVDWPWS